MSVQDIKKETWVLTDEGRKYAAEGSPEVQLFLAVPPEGSIGKDELQVVLTVHLILGMMWELISLVIGSCIKIKII